MKNTLGHKTVRLTKKFKAKVEAVEMDAIRTFLLFKERSGQK